MKRFVVVILFVFGLTACGNEGTNTDARVETIDGVECLVIRNAANNNIRALDCNWENNGD